MPAKAKKTEPYKYHFMNNGLCASSEARLAILAKEQSDVKGYRYHTERAEQFSVTAKTVLKQGIEKGLIEDGSSDIWWAKFENKAKKMTDDQLVSMSKRCALYRDKQAKLK